MKFLFILLALIPLSSQASFLFNYDLNYSSENDASSGLEYEKSRTFHKVFLGASVNGEKTFFLGWNLNSWSSSLKYQTNAEDSYGMLEMGPRVLWFFDSEFRWYLDAEWNPYAKGEREKGGTSRDISGHSFGAGLGYRFKISPLVGLGASIHYHLLSIGEEKVGSTVNDMSDKVANLMPMLELSILIR